MLDLPTAARLARMILGCLHREYPYHLVHVVDSAADVRPPRELTPSFYGCYDWHSAVHGHWSLVRLLRMIPQADWADEVRAALSRSFTPENIASEVGYQTPAHRTGFERPYGLAWLLQLAAELREERVAPFLQWSEMLRPLEDLAVQKLSAWIPRLPFPIRSGEHSQTAFAFGLCLDWARACAARTDVHASAAQRFGELVAERSLAFYRSDRNGPLAYEPSGHDFLSPCLAEADLLRRILPAQEFADWLTDFLPTLSAGSADWLSPVASPDPSDGKLAHLDGLNLSRAWMLEGIAAGLPAADPRRSILLEAASRHGEAGLAALTGEHYAGSHWLGTFAVYVLTR